MATRRARNNRNGSNLEQAMALLVNNQAALVAQHTSFLNEMAESRKEFRQEFAGIRKELEMIKAVLVRHDAMLEKLPEVIRDLDDIKTVLGKHETMLEKLPEAVREKIGYQR